MLVAGLVIRIVNEDGELLRSLILDPSEAYRDITKWRWGDSNPRPRTTDQGFSGRSRW